MNERHQYQAKVRQQIDQYREVANIHDYVTYFLICDHDPAAKPFAARGG